MTSPQPSMPPRDLEVMTNMEELPSVVHTDAMELEDSINDDMKTDKKGEPSAVAAAVTGEEPVTDLMSVDAVAAEADQKDDQAAPELEPKEDAEDEDSQSPAVPKRLKKVAGFKLKLKKKNRERSPFRSLIEPYDRDAIMAGPTAYDRFCAAGGRNTTFPILSSSYYLMHGPDHHEVQSEKQFDRIKAKHVKKLRNEGAEFREEDLDGRPDMVQAEKELMIAGMNVPENSKYDEDEKQLSYPELETSLENAWKKAKETRRKRHIEEMRQKNDSIEETTPTNPPSKEPLADGETPASSEKTVATFEDSLEEKRKRWAHCRTPPPSRYQLQWEADRRERVRLAHEWVYYPGLQHLNYSPHQPPRDPDFFVPRQ